MAEDKSKTVIVKARAKAFLTSQPEENDPLTAVTVHKRTVSKPQKSAPSAAEIAAAIRKGEVSEAGKSVSKGSEPDAKKATVVVVAKQEPIINRKNKLMEGGRLKKIPACKMAEPMKRPADDTLIITGKVTAASKRIQTPVAAVKSAAVKVEEVKAEKPAVKPEQTAAKPAAKPAVKKAEPKKEAAKPAAKPAVKKAEPKKAAAKPAAKPAVKKAEPKKTAMVRNTYIQYQNDTYKEADLVALAEKLWTKDMKRKAADLKSLELYVKPQERMAYCVFNKKETGSFAI